ncbi:MAG: glycoside hydrolase family 3 C-terminal domain-containing protein, partial [Clostridia bacterium]|nr:glycoside hydrolase family 3 C-terminal domain-containing protein [Clostridia bacterium]
SMLEHDGVTLETTAYPCLALVSCSWDPQIAYFMGNSIADSYVENGVHLVLGPGLNMKRTPLSGRNFEYFSEDPYLTGTLARAYVEGLQDKGVGATLKHFAVNNGDNHRMYQNSELDERTLYETYLRAFEIALEAKPWAVMCSYNKVNGVFASENKRLLDDVLRGEFGFDGIIMSDWSAVKNRAKSLKATLDLEMPSFDGAFDELKDAYKKGLITDEEIDASVARLVELSKKVYNDKRKVEYTAQERHENVRKIAEASMVLLKNDNAVLPLEAGATIDLLYGAYGNVSQGGGSAYVKHVIQDKGLAVSLSEQGFTVAESRSHENTIGDCEGDYQIVTVSVCERESEGLDRTTIRLCPSDEHKIVDLTRRSDKVIVVIYAGSAVDVSRFVDKVAAIVYAGYAGEASGEALANILSGKVCPSGKLSETFPVRLEDCPVDPETERPDYIYYAERFYIGYRHYEKYGIRPQFAFGHGLSYAKFEYSDVEIKQVGDTDFDVSYTVKNISSVTGKEVSQIYVHDVAATCDRPEKELRAYSKDEIKAGESKRITVRLNKDAFAFYNPAIGAKYVENGRFDILVGAASNDIRLKATLKIALDDSTQYSFEHVGWKRGIAKNGVNAFGALEGKK